MKNEKTDLAQYLFHEGTNCRSYEYLGCHLEEQTDKGYKYVFRTWAPNARHVALVGDYFGWEDGLSLERTSEKGVWELYVNAEASLHNTRYKFKIWTDFTYTYKGDPYAFYSEGGERGASIVWDDTNFDWKDGAWLRSRRENINRDGHYLSAPINIYELHFGSFARRMDGGYYSYTEMAEILIPYVKYMGYTHVELMPIAEHPFDGSWGYQICSYYAPSSRFGNPDDFRSFVSLMHRAGIGVILDWVPAHFPKDEWGLYEFDGRPLYEYQGFDRMESKSWGTRFFDLGREEVQSFLISNAVYWFSEFHIDGLRVDAVASMLYLDYDRMPWEWIPNVYGGKENLEAVAFLQKLNSKVFELFPDVLMIAEESTAWRAVTRPVSDGGLGFNLKWNMGWANDFFHYISLDPIYRKYHHSALNFPIMYAFSENYVLPVSHDEVVYGKGSFIGKFFGSYEEKFKQFRAALVFMMTFPGKKMTFMGTEFAQFSEWNYRQSLEWFMLDFDAHYSAREFVASLNRFYLYSRALWELDFESEGFEWIFPDENEGNFLAYRRYSASGEELICLISFSGSDNKNIRIRANEEYVYRYAFETENVPREEMGFLKVVSDEYGAYIETDLPSMSAIVIRREEKI